jgi:GNAT superfamily N-acetyltransferase
VRVEGERRTSPGDLVIRHAVAADLAALVALLEYGSLTPGKEDPGDLAPYRAALADIDAGPGALLAAVADGEVVGVCQLIVFRHIQHRDALCAEVESVHVHPTRRGEGIGSALVAEAIAQARRLGCYRVQLTSNRERPRAHRFYESLGFMPSHQGFKFLLEGD